MPPFACHNGAPGAIETFTGRLVSPPNIPPEDIDILDIAHHLSQEPRHGGACLRRISVAQHCCMVHDLLDKQGYPPETWFCGLLHDAEEAYLRDLPRPIKHRPEMRFYVDAGRELRERVFDKYRVDTTDWSAVKTADNVCVAAEIKQWKRSGGSRLSLPDFPDEPRITPWLHERQGEVEFLERFIMHRPEMNPGMAIESFCESYRWP